MSISSFLKKKFFKSLFFPSHNRGQALPRNIIKLLRKYPGSWDLPELPELGSPTTEKGLVVEAQNYFSKKFSTNQCWFGVNGASGLIQSGILAMAKRGNYLLMPRNIHTCVIKACIIANLTPILFDIEYSEETGHYLPITTEWFKKVLNNKLLNDIQLAGIVLVNPYYQGYASDIESLIYLSHEKNIPVLVDEAHGAYFLFCDNYGLPKSAVSSKADLVVHSLHKSLNGLSQTAILWQNGSKIEHENVQQSINLLQTTSPNSLLLSSCEESLNDWIEINSLRNFQKRINIAKNTFDELFKRGIPVVRNDDPFKIILNTGLYGIDGFSADKFFYENGLIAELPEMMTITFVLGFAKQKNFVSILENLWNKLLLTIKPHKQLKNIKPPFKSIQMPCITPSEAWMKKSYKIPIKESVGKVCAEIVCPYPPGIPLVIPGEIIDQERVDWIIEKGKYCEDLYNFYIKVLIT